MFIKSTDGLSEGFRAAFDVYDLKGSELVRNGAQLKPAVIEHLKISGIPNVYTDEKPEVKVNTVFDPATLRGLLRVLYYFTSTGGENAEILKRYNQDEVRRFLSYTNDAGSRIAYGHIFKFLAGGLIKSIKAAKKQVFDFTDYRDKNTYHSFHAVNTACIAAVIGYNMGLQEQELEDLIIGTLLFDVRMFAYEFINENRELAAGEKEEMRQHPIVSFDMIKRIYGISSSSASIAIQHHERVDGSGYPKGLKAGDINILSRIASVADVYDALTSSRPFRKAYLPEEAWDHISGNSGILFDPDVIEEFKRSIPRFKPGDIIEVCGGGMAIVCENTYAGAETPNIKLIEKNSKSDIISCGDKGNFAAIKTIKTSR